MRRPFTWSKCGEHAPQYEFQHRGKKYSILPAISLDGIVHLDILENGVTGADFHCFAQDLLPHMNEWPLPNSVLVIDNASIHKVASIREMVEECGALMRPALCWAGKTRIPTFSTVPLGLEFQYFSTFPRYAAPDRRTGPC
jgi:DDE superfamily endonuclease